MDARTTRFDHGQCAQCRHPLTLWAKFCPGCGLSVEPHCGACGVASAPGAHFCGVCGAVLAAPSAAPPSPGPAAPVAAAPFAPAAPAASWSPPPVAPVRRSPLPRIVAVGGGTALVAVLAVAAWALFLRGEETGTPADGGPADVQQSTVAVTAPVAVDAVDPTLGLPLRPAVRLTHPDGAVANIPGGAALYGDAMDLRRVELGADPWWEHGGAGWEFVSFVGIPFENASTVDLPVASGPAGGRAIVRTAAGLWAEMPSTAVTLAGGKAALRVSVTNVPAPWTFAVATPKAGAPALTAGEQEDIRLEQLYWTDRAAWEAETLAWLKTDPLARSLPDARYASRQAPDITSQIEAIADEKREAVRVLRAARVGLMPDVTITGGLAPIPGVAITGFALYADGVQRLALARDRWLELRPTLGEFKNLPLNDGLRAQLTEEGIETTMHEYTPWGIDFVKGLLDTGGLNGLDLRVLKPYGELKWADITLKAGAAPTIDNAVAGVLAEEQDARIGGDVRYQRTLRLYSVRAMERLALIDWLKDNVDWVVRWLPVALVGAGWVAGVAIIPGAVGLSLFFASADQIINWVQDWYTKGDTSPYAYLAFEGTSAGGVGGASFLMDMWEEKALMASEGRAMLPAHGLTIAQFAYSVGMFVAVRGTDWYTFKTIRDINAGTRGYCEWNRCDSTTGAVPPVMVHVRATGLLEQEPGAYRASVDRIMAYRLEYGTADFHTGWLQGHRGPNGDLADLPFNDYARNGWPVVVERTQPEYQVMRLAIPKAAIAPEVWGSRPTDTSIAEFGPTLFLEGPNGEGATIEIKADSERRPNEKDDHFYVTAVLRTKDAAELRTGDSFGPGYEGATEHQAVLSIGGELRMTLKGTITFADERTKPIDFALDFGPNPPKPADLSNEGKAEAGEPVPQRVHYIEATLSNDLFGTYQVTSWKLGAGGNADMVLGYMQESLLPFGRSCETPGTCRFELYHIPARGIDPDRFMAQVCGPSKSGTYCRGLAESRKVKEIFPENKQDMLPPERNDNFFNLSGPTLTGSDEYGVAWSPGETGKVYSWGEIRAEFKDETVTGTITFSQVPNVQEMGVIRSITFTFEAVKNK